jgi:glyoxylase-like metal-dependent hydrolase (beta-lactamase superfamily II)
LLQLKQFKGLQVIGGKDCASVTKTPAHGEEFKIGDRISVKALHTPCHTQDSICYYMQDGDQRAVFTGDTLFIGGMCIAFKPLHPLRESHELILITGCGRFFEGNAKEMHKALNETLAALPDDTKVYVGLSFRVDTSLMLTLSSLATSIPRPMSSSALLSHKQSLLRSSRRLRTRTSRHKGNSLSAMKR